MAKKIEGYLKLQIPAGKANPSPPVGPALGQRGLNIMEFCKAFNANTQDMEPGSPCPTVITYYVDKSFSMDECLINNSLTVFKGIIISSLVQMLFSQLRLQPY